MLKERCYDLPQTFLISSSATVVLDLTTATLLLIVACVKVFGRYLTFENIPNRVAELAINSIHFPWVFLFAMNVLLLIVGMFMDIMSATLILGLVFLPLLSPFNVNPMHFWLLMTVNLAIGYCPAHGRQSFYCRRHDKKRHYLCDQGGHAGHNYQDFCIVLLNLICQIWFFLCQSF